MLQNAIQTYFPSFFLIFISLNISSLKSNYADLKMFLLEKLLLLLWCPPQIDTQKIFQLLIFMDMN